MKEILWSSSLKVSKSQKHFSLNSIAQKPNEIFEEILPYDFNTGYIFFQIPSQGENIKNKRAPLLLCSNDKLWWDSGHRPSWLSSSVVRSVTKEMRGEIQITNMTNFTQLCTKNGKIHNDIQQPLQAFNNKKD